MTHKLENSQPIINIEIANNTLYVLIYLISTCLDYSTVITTLHYITVYGAFIWGGGGGRGGGGCIVIYYVFCRDGFLLK